MWGGRPRTDHIADPGKEARAAAGIPIVPAFDGYRAIAILGVVMLHVLMLAGVVGEAGLASRLIWGTLGHAVEILFVVSGFVVFLPTVVRGNFGNLRSFTIRRGARLLPAYWMILLISLVVIGTLHPGFSKLPDPLDLALNFSGLSIPAGLFIPGISTGFGLNKPLWTVSVEICFYLVLPLIAGAYFRRPLFGLLTALLVTVIWTVGFDHIQQLSDLFGLSPTFREMVRLTINSSLQLPVWAYSFGLGMTGAWAWVRLSPRRPGWIGPLAIGSGLCLLALAWGVGGSYDQTRESLLLSLFFSTALAVFMVSLSLAPRRWQLVVASPSVRQLGDISYGIYLSHMMIAITLFSETSLLRDGGLRSILFWTLAVVPGSVLYGYLSARFLEQPIRRWARKYGRRS